MNPLKVIADLVSGLAAFFRFKERKQELDNDPRIVANQEAKRDATIRDSATEAVKTDDLEAIRKQAAE